MDRCGVFVDAGYLLAQAGELCLGTKSRVNIALDHAKATAALLDFAREHGGHEPLRLYWYDAAPNAVAMPEQQAIGSLPRVKVRLGRLVGPKDHRQQKGVDSLVVRDLIVLAKERAICTAYVLAGDEDLREGVATAQEQGMQVVLLGIPGPAGDPNQAQSLIREVDEHAVLGKDFWESLISAKEAAPVQVLAPSAGPPGSSLEESGQAFALAWLKAATPEEIEKLLLSRPRIPVELDAQILSEAEKAVSVSLRGDQDSRKRLRAAFWKTVETEVKKPHEAGARTAAT